jgi:hypothetical protein
MILNFISVLRWAEREEGISMDKITVSLINGNGLNIVDHEALTEVIPMNGLSLDNDRIVGLDNFQIEAKRAKISVRLLNKNQAFNETLKSYLTNPDNLIGTIAGTREDISCLVFDHNRLMSIFSEKKLFERHFGNLTQTWSAEATAGDLYVQSPMMLGIIYQCMIKARHHTVPGGFNGVYSMMAMDTISSMMLKMFSLSTGIAVDSTGSISTIVTNYLNSLKSGYGTTVGLDTFLRFPWLYRIIFNGPAIPSTLEWFANNLVRNNTNVTRFYVKSFSGVWVWVDKGSIPVTPEGHCVCIALYLSSIMKYDLFSQLQTIYFNNNQDPLQCLIDRHSGSSIGQEYRVGTFVPFYNMYEVVLSCNIYSGNLTPTTVTFVPGENGPIAHSAKNRILDEITTSGSNIAFCTKNFGVNGIQVGKTQVRTETEETESGMEIVTLSPENIPTDSLFVPVQRTFGIRPLTQEQIDNEGLVYIPSDELVGGSYKFYIENIKHNELFSQDDSESILKTGGWVDTNWMYFNHIYVTERVLNESEQTYVDNIPLFDIEEGESIDNFGLYMYRDYFEKFYPKEKSSFLNAYLQISVGNTLLFTGIIDFTTVKTDKGIISFEAVDAIGVLIDNLEKMNDFVSFSQFDTGDYVTVNERAGTTLKNFLEAIIRKPFPYRTRFANPQFSVPENVEGINNKILKDIQASEAFTLAVQCCKRLLFANAEGMIDFADVLSGEYKTIDGEILSISERHELDRETFSIDKLKSIAGYNHFVPDIVSYYMGIREMAVKELDVEIYGQEDEIKILDNIEVDGEMYIVTEKNLLFRSK